MSGTQYILLICNITVNDLPTSLTLRTAATLKPKYYTSVQNISSFIHTWPEVSYNIHQQLCPQCVTTSHFSVDQLSNGVSGRSRLELAFDTITHHALYSIVN